MRGSLVSLVDDDRTVLRGRVVTPDGILDDGIVAVAGDRIAWVGRADQQRSALDRPADGDGWPAPLAVAHTVLPGLVDVHCHGAAGRSFPEGTVAAARAVARHHLEHGTTSVLASLVTAPAPDLISAVDALAGMCASGELAGIHLEGPFLSTVRCGAQDPAWLREPDLSLTAELLGAGRGHVATVTYAPELPRAAALVDALVAAGVVPSVGHTDADAATTSAFLRRAGSGLGGRAVSVTHLFNGMRPLHHRDPGPVAACLAAAARGEAMVELIADGVHLADQTTAAVFDLVGPGAVLLVTDAMAAAGMADGRYELGPARVVVVGGVARLAGAEPPEAGSLAGGTARLVDVVRRCVTHAGVDLVAAVTAASATPARLLGLDAEVGSLRAGMRADILCTDEDLRPSAVMRAGAWVSGGLSGPRGWRSW